MLDEARIPPRYRRCSSRASSPIRTRNCSVPCAGRERFAESFPRSRQGLCLIGPPGSARRISPSPCCGASSSRAARAGCSTTRAICCASSAAPTTRLSRPRRWTSCGRSWRRDLLVLDDLGSEKTSEWVEETMNLIVNTRYNERRHTIFTSNYDDTPDDRRARLPQGAHRLPHPLAAARDVRVPRVRRRRLPPSCRRTAASTTCWRCGRWRRAAAASCRPRAPRAHARPAEAGQRLARLIGWKGGHG